jgi:hypothetical protein
MQCAQVLVQPKKSHKSSLYYFHAFIYQTTLLIHDILKWNLGFNISDTEVSYSLFHVLLKPKSQSYNSVLDHMNVNVSEMTNKFS